MRNKSIVALVGAGAVLGMAAVSQAAPVANAALSLTSTGGTIANPTYTYSIALNDTGATTIGSFWFAWIPGQDYMQTSPLSIVNPTNWHSVITGGGGTDGYAIQWVANSSASYVPAGGSLSTFAFTSSDSPSSLAGFSSFFPTKHVTTSVVYSAGLFSDAGLTFVVSVPEPTGATSLGMAVGAMLLGRRRRLA